MRTETDATAPRTVILRGTLVETSNDECDLLGFVPEGHSEPQILTEAAVEALGGASMERLTRWQVSVRYWTAPEPLTAEEGQRAALQTLRGDLEAQYAVYWSETTGYLWTDEVLQVGGHDLVRELGCRTGEFLHLEIDVHADA